MAVQGSLSRGAILGLDNIGWSGVMLVIENISEIKQHSANGYLSICKEKRLKKPQGQGKLCVA